MPSFVPCWRAAPHMGHTTAIDRRLSIAVWPLTESVDTTELDVVFTHPLPQNSQVGTCQQQKILRSVICLPEAPADKTFLALWSMPSIVSPEHALPHRSGER